MPYICDGEVYCDACGQRDDYPREEYVYEMGESDNVNHCANGETCADAVRLVPDGTVLYGAETACIGAMVTDELTDDGETYIRQLVADCVYPTPYQVAVHRLWRETFPWAFEDDKP